MYGLVNKAIKEFVTINYGHEMWDETYKELELSDNQFLSLENIPDHVTFQLLSKVCDKSGRSMDEMAEQIGNYFLSFAADEGFDDLFELAGDNLPELLQNLNELHFRVKAFMPHLNPPRFEVSEQTDHSLKLHYFSSRDGLTYFLLGALKGLTKKFELDATLTVLPPVGDEKCIVLISWN